MRTSRVSRQTAHLVDALSPRRIRSSTGQHLDNEASPSRSEGRGSTLLSSSGQKRKRAKTTEDADPSVEVVTKVEESTSIRTSPRKAGTSDKPKKARRQPAKRRVDENGELTIDPPPNWEEVYSLTKQMRAQQLAPVDTMGCESLAEDRRSPRDKRFQTLIALMLSSQTKDTVTAVAIKNLQDHLPGGLTLEAVLDVDPPVLNELINKVGFHNNKTKFIKAVAPILVAEHKSDIPDSVEGLCALPGVGPKMAYLCMSAAWGRDEGIGVDVHVHRITNLWGWHKTSTPEETRAALESWLPKSLWHDINHVLVGFGQTWCPPVGKKCDECNLAAKGLCPSAVVGKTVKKRVKKEEVKVKGEEEGNMVKTAVEIKIEEQPIKAEQLDCDKHVLDIEDIGQTRRSSRRLGG